MAICSCKLPGCRETAPGTQPLCDDHWRLTHPFGQKKWRAAWKKRDVPTCNAILVRLLWLLLSTLEAGALPMPPQHNSATPWGCTGDEGGSCRSCAWNLVAAHRAVYGAEG